MSYPPNYPQNGNPGGPPQSGPSAPFPQQNYPQMAGHLPQFPGQGNTPQYQPASAPNGYPPVSAPNGFPQNGAFHQNGAHAMNGPAHQQNSYHPPTAPGAPSAQFQQMKISAPATPQPSGAPPQPAVNGVNPYAPPGAPRPPSAAPVPGPPSMLPPMPSAAPLAPQTTASNPSVHPQQPPMNQAMPGMPPMNQPPQQQFRPQQPPTNGPAAVPPMSVAPAPSFPGSAPPPAPGAPTSSFPGAPPVPGQFPGMPGGQGLPGGHPGAPMAFPPMPGNVQQQPGAMPPGPLGMPGPGMMPGGAPTPGMPGVPGMMPGGAPGAGMPPMGGMPGGPPGMAGPGMMPGGAPGAGMPPMGGMPGGPPGMMLGGAPGAGMPPMGGMPGGPPGMPGMPPGYPQQPRQRLDPNAMPSAVSVMEENTANAGLFPTGFPNAEYPPLVSTDFHIQDQGNCNPRLMRSTLYVAPASNDVLKNSSLPFAVAVSPFAKLHDKEFDPPVVDLGPGGPVRCQRCKAYMCPFMEFQDGGRRFRCPFCHASTPVEDVYFAHLDHTGRRTDIDHRPELYLGAYDFVATKQYCKNGLPPKEPAYIFMIDVSYNAVSSGMLNVLCHNLDKILTSLPKETGQAESSIHVGLATFDQAVHFYDLSSSKPSMMVVGDVTEMFVPIVDGLLVPYSQGAANIRAVLAEIPKLFSQTKTTETMLGPVVNAGLDALKCADRAGKLFIFSTSLPTMEAPGKLKVKNDRALLGTDKEKSALTPQTDYYTKLGEQCVKAGVTVDLFLFPNSFIDVATIGQLSAVTGGTIYKYQYFSGEKDTVRFMTDLQTDVARRIGFDCMVRVRSSAGIRPVSFMGSFYMENSTDLEIASIDEDKCFFAELKHDDKLSDANAVIQTAVLYTSITGQRRLRILNLCLPVSSDYNNVYRVADPDTLHTFLLKQAVQINRDKGNQEVRNQLSQRAAQILATYREKCSEQAPLGQLILPETLKLLPLFANSILKNDAVGAGSESTVDDKAWMIELVRGMGVADTTRMLYPRVYPVADLEIHDPSGLTTLPKAVRASMEYMPAEGAYLIDTGFILFLWVGLQIPEAWVRDVFGAPSVQQMDTENHIIPEKHNDRSRALRHVIQLLSKGIRTRKIYVVRQQDGLEPWMKKYLVEDKSSPNAMSYVEFLCHVHREIRNILS